MTKMFSNMTGEALEQAEDRVGGGFQAIPTGIYDATITMAYAIQSAGGAHGIVLLADVGGKELRETIYITNRKGENFYPDKNDSSKKMPLPGFTLVDDICLLTTGEPLAEQSTDEKKVKVYDPNQKKEVPTDVPVLTGLLGQKIKLAVLRVIEDKQKKGDDGNYHNTGETRTINQIDKALHAETSRTVNEYRHEVETPEFHDEWVKARITSRNGDTDVNRSTGGGAGGGAGASGSGRPGGAGTGAPKKKLFGK